MFNTMKGTASGLKSDSWTILIIQVSQSVLYLVLVKNIYARKVTKKNKLYYIHELSIILRPLNGDLKGGWRPFSGVGVLKRWVIFGFAFLLLYKLSVILYEFRCYKKSFVSR